MMSPLPNFQIVNRFLEDTSVITTLAYLLSRGTLLPRLFEAHRRRRDQFILALVFGLIGGSELIFPGDRYPYVTHTLAAAFAGYAGGWALGLLTCSAMTIFAIAAWLLGISQTALPHYALAVVSASLVGSTLAATRRWLEGRHERPTTRLSMFLATAFAAGALGEVAHGLLSRAFLSTHLPMSALSIFYSASANGFGCLLLGLVLWDAHQRQAANQHHVLAEQELAHLRLSQLGELQARLHPHFLFNALAGIAGLCVVNPAGAEQGVTNLATLLRQFLRTPNDVAVPLREERETVHAYLTVERLRLGDRLQVREDIPEKALSLRVPRFCLQVPVENAVQHGLAATEAGGRVSIVARRYPRHLLLAVGDTGPGLPMRPRHTPPARPEGEAPHGLELLAARLALAYGPAARLRLFSGPGRGTLCVLRLPLKEL